MTTVTNGKVEYINPAGLHRNPAFSNVVMVFVNRIDQLRIRVESVKPKLVLAFTQVPAVVAAKFDDVDLFPDILPYIGNPEQTGFSIKRHSPWITKSPGEDFLTAQSRLTFERIVCRNGVLLVAFGFVDIDSQDRAQ